MRRLIGLGSPAAIQTLDNQNINNKPPTTTFHHIHNHNHHNNTPACNSTPTRPPPSRRHRQPLQERDENVMMRMPLKSQPHPPPLHQSNNGKAMPHHDKNNPRPLMPTLSAAAQKTANRTPLTPRVAAGHNATPTQPARPRPENRTPGTTRDEILTPVSTFLSHNITPRSGSRKSRVDSTNTTPTGTPNTTPAPQFQDLSPPMSGLGIGGMDRDVPKRPTVSFSPQLSEVGSTRAAVQPKSADSKFFFASDAKSAQTPPTRPPLPPQKSSSFLYANGDTIPVAPQSSSRSAVGSDIGEERSQPRFFHANGTPDLQASPSPHFAPPRPSSTVSTSSRMTSPRLANSSPGTLSPIQRPISPTKLSQPPSIPALRTAPQMPSPNLARPPALGRGSSSNGIVAARRASIERQKSANHGRSDSVTSTGQPSRRVSGESIAEIIAPVTPANLVITTNTVTPPKEPSESPKEVESMPSGLQSPTKAGHSLEKMNELASNARRERKVLDLEITNSSLAAINRTLEREMRKQTAELRRYRRLSRSGRLSIATTASIRTSSGTLSLMDGEEGQMLSDMSEEEESELEEDSDYSSESNDEGPQSPGAMAESDLRHRKRDERRLQLDLSKHQQLLIDSQKMNQSLKKCLGWTEELIAEGKKALAYSVMVSDVKLGGRILVPDEGEDDNEGMSDIGAHFLKEARLAAAAKAAAGDTWHIPERDETDSGIEIDVLRREEFESNNLMPAIKLDR